MDGILGVGPLELIIIVVLALVILGPERLPDTIRQVARFIRQARAIGNELTSQFSEELNLLDDFNPKKILEDVVGDEDDDFDAKSMLGITKDDLKVGIDDKKSKTKTNSAKTATKKTTSTTNTKKINPALGDVDPEETTAIDAVVDKPQSDKAKPAIETSKANGNSSDASNAKPSDAAADSVDGSIKSGEPVSKNGGSSTTTANASKERITSDTVESVTENSIAPPSMTSTQSPSVDKNGPSDAAIGDSEKKLAETVAKEISGDGAAQSTSTADADADTEVPKDAREV